jgi:hypothetical protein
MTSVTVKSCHFQESFDVRGSARTFDCTLYVYIDNLPSLYQITPFAGLGTLYGGIYLFSTSVESITAGYPGGLSWPPGAPHYASLLWFGFEYLTLSPQGGVCSENLFHPEEYRTCWNFTR